MEDKMRYNHPSEAVSTSQHFNIKSCLGFIAIRTSGVSVRSMSADTLRVKFTRDPFIRMQFHEFIVISSPVGQGSFFLCIRSIRRFRTKDLPTEGYFSP
jgi:hypothetical protein